jgi:hypothetical protein
MKLKREGKDKSRLAVLGTNQYLLGIKSSIGRNLIGLALMYCGKAIGKCKS